ncbi:TPA: UDP-N-acetylmuramoyl-L-alanine--D-glutamate ligase [Patescibacteria group bacterium]|uniref:UDP-N-acetylmuramoylalanine--D-glutamate ligase n=2 Tax=Bacteria division Kazan-3B-28 TaxID=1798534 RepID=A0A0G1X6S6_UNCK3|nr:MAG: UDP-N-acetylmuramoylalanine-D-glutamate ligase [candidate division Kazan bacterium GW2011_GWA1_50_15]KKW25563.1 MAG: UDP-N-acetylmuramoylalanine-D-glutamate ligase [candidate division Kazan bacterium GW2011_GWC1_52_13]KKW26868.1 MAG: UDP-N-acetylmuramoylalanine-D-glutamate ligase [candidate division Kazan bacterium GW2011_GWB1_52_7]HAV65863.1 UDP-N-acetylmuramoyl-L-alanine--D-glutamate ligase [Patescibacteria group bacterium]HCL47858.1 UDP-N-acetylmuramoyl-L-alanine--D-glutamate ligase 
MAKVRFQGKKTAVIGLGREGIELVRWLRRQGALVTVLDRVPASKLGVQYKEAKHLGAEFRLGDQYLSNLTDFEVVFRSPGVPLQLIEFKRAIKAGVAFSSTIQLFLELAPARIIGVTGTKGKSTTTSLIHHLLKGGQRWVFLAGNIGTSPLPLLTKIKSGDTVVLELSSFQLEDLTRSPDIAVMLNVVPEHLDRHKTFSKYLAAKQNIYTHQGKADWLIASYDFVPTKEALRRARGKTLPISTRQILRKGVYLSKGEIVYRHWRSGRRQVITSATGLKLMGEHNLQNVLPAIATALVSNVPVKTIAKKLRSFKPLKHRIELVRRIGDVSFINDSLGTTPEAAAAAILAFPNLPKAIIVGGVYKGGDISALAKTAATGNVRMAVLIGGSAKKFQAAFKRFAPKVSTKLAKTFPQAVKEAIAAVRTHGLVMLTPACASFDMFKDAYDRGDQFKKIVNHL